AMQAPADADRSTSAALGEGSSTGDDHCEAGRTAATGNDALGAGSQHRVESAQFRSVSPDAAANAEEKLLNHQVVQQKVAENRHEIASQKTVSILTGADAGVAASALPAVAAAAEGSGAGDDADDVVDEEARTAALGLMHKAMMDF